MIEQFGARIGLIEMEAVATLDVFGELSQAGGHNMCPFWLRLGPLVPVEFAVSYDPGCSAYAVGLGKAPGFCISSHSHPEINARTTDDPTRFEDILDCLTVCVEAFQAQYGGGHG